ncbi:MAG: DUF502 domain-containing protein [Nannocystaceae bacterium]
MSAAKKLRRHLKKTLLTGIFSTIPLVVTVAVVVYVEKSSRAPVKALFGIDVPFIGFAVALAVIYLVGLVVSSIVGRMILDGLDRLLLKVPVLRELYKAWKQVSLTPGGREGIYAKVVLVPDGERSVLAFTSGDPLDGDPERCCVYIPEVPNPMVGRLFVVERARCTELNVSVEEAFKMILSSGNYVPKEIGRQTALAAEAAAAASDAAPSPAPAP